MRRSDDYIEKALRNIEEDRDRLVKLYDELDIIGAAEGSGEADPFVRQAISDNLVKIVDSLTKQTGQVVELAKLKQKLEKPVTDGEELTDSDKSSVYDVIEGSAMHVKALELIDAS